jgi:hypothetical protein
MKAQVRRLVLALMVVIAALAVTSSPAGAHGVTLLWGQGQYDVLGTSYVNHGDQVGMWQAFLFSYDQIACTQEDGIFGSGTAQGTRNLQAFWGITSDGVVGHNTWSTASSWLSKYGDDGFLTTYYVPAFASRGWIDGIGQFYYVYGGGWTWDSNGEPGSDGTYRPSDHSEIASFGTNHPGISFGMGCPL